jgi:hypothetical protein
LIRPRKAIAALIAAALVTASTTACAGEPDRTLHFRGAIVVSTDPSRRLHGAHPTSATMSLHIGRGSVGATEWTSDLLEYFADFALEEAKIVTASYH